jgi:cystathionine gamma-lyase
MQGFASNGHIISIADLYGGTYRYLTRVAEAHGVSATFTTAIESDMESLIQDNTKLIWIESPSNPTLSLVDIKLVTQVAHKRGVLVVVDNTLLSPYLQNPLEFDADLVLHSVTKSINGHSVSRYTIGKELRHKLMPSGRFDGCCGLQLRRHQAEAFLPSKCYRERTKSL